MALRTPDVQPQVQFQPDPNGLPPGASTAGVPTGGSGLPPWVTPDQAQFYQTLNAGWKQGHGGQDIPMERFQYLQNAYNSEAAQGANGSHVGDMGWWQNRAAIDRGPDPGEPGYTGDGSFSGGSPSGGSTYGGGGAFQMPSGFSTNPSGPNAPFSAPGLLAPYNQTFTPTNINTILDSDAFKAAQANGVDQIQRSAAGRGTLLTGGTLKDLASWTNGLALGALNDQFNRDATTFGTNRDTFWGNENNAFNKLSNFSQLGLQGAGQLGGYGTTYGNTSQNNANQQSNLQTGQADANASNAIARANNTNATLGGLATDAGSIDWSKLFNRGKAGYGLGGA